MADKDACPVDHKTRDAWLAQARASEASKPPTSSLPPTACPVDHTAASSQPSKSWTQTISSYIPWSSSQPQQQPSQPESLPNKKPGLGSDRAVSSIPRSSTNTSGDTVCPVPHGASANAETVDAETHGSGNWVYPSEKMFFEAMKRKGYDARVADMKTVVPIHNAVNERAWEEIKQWEAPYLKDST